MALRVNPKEERQGKLYILKEPKSSKEKRKEYIEGRRRRQNKKQTKGNEDSECENKKGGTMSYRNTIQEPYAAYPYPDRAA